MATTIRPELSKKNPYWIEKQRFYELKHFCLQYPEWKKAYLALDGLAKRHGYEELGSKTGHGDPTARCVVLREFYKEHMDMVEHAAAETDPELGDYIFVSVTGGHSYDYLKARLGIPCCKDTYYRLYRKFFWLLDQERW